MPTIPFHLIDAFNSKPFSGNVAAVVLLDQKTKEKFVADDLLRAIAMELNQPATAFVSRKGDSESSTSYDISWFDGVGGELNLCGHATLAASKVLFDQLNTSADAWARVSEIEYNSGVGPLQAKLLDDGRIELQFPAAGLDPLVDSFNAEEVQDIQSIVRDAIQDGGVELLEFQRGVGKAFDHWLLVKVNCSNKALKDVTVRHEVIEQLAKYNLVKVGVTTRGNLSPSQASGSPSDCHIESRMFAPAIGHREDQVTGSMHGLLAPFWTKDFRRTESVDRRTELSLRSRQVSSREGILDVIWREDSESVLIKGDGFHIGEGELAF